MKWDMKNLAIAIMFFIFDLLCIFSLITSEVTSYYITGLVVFTIVGIGFLKRARK